MLGLRIDRVASGSHGDYLSSFCHRLTRRSLLAVRGPASDHTKIAVPAVSSRIIIIVLRSMGTSLRHEMIARGNCIGDDE